MAQTNEATVVAVFEDYTTAQTVARELVDSGIPREAVQVRSNFATGAAGSGQQYDMEREEHRGGISGFFHNLFGSHHSDYDETGHYDEAIRRGNAVVTATASADVLERAVEIMNQHHPIDIDRRVAAYRETGYERYDPKAPAYTAEEAARERKQFSGTSSSKTIPVVEEELQVGKRVIRRGGVRIFSHVVDTPVEENIVLREEHVRVERRPVDRVLNANDSAALRDQSVEVEEMVEEPVVSKRARVKEEVVVGKESTEKKQQIRDTVRRTDVKVEKMEAGTSDATDYRQDFRRDYEANYARSGVPYNSLEPAYEYGYRSASDARYRGKSWSDAESELKTDYLRNNPNSTWDQIKGAVRYGWEKVTGKR